MEVVIGVVQNWVRGHHMNEEDSEEVTVPTPILSKSQSRDKLLFGYRVEQQHDADNLENPPGNTSGTPGDRS